MNAKLYAPKGFFRSGDDAAAKKRKELAERLKRGEAVNVTNSGQVVTPKEAQEEHGKTLRAPEGKLADDAAAKKRKELAERLKRGEAVNVTNSGQVVTPKEAQEEHGKTLRAPEGKLAAGFYWYEKNPTLYEAEKQAMSEFFPRFQLDKLDDGRICWIGTLNPRGSQGGVWTVMAIYDHNHPHNNTYGGSVRVYSIKPDLEELHREAGGLPHILTDSNGDYYMCTARKEDVRDGRTATTSASSALGNAAKWIWAVEGWLAGEIGDEVFDHTF